MSKLLILGAGASYGNGFSSDISEKPPMLKNFFKHPLFKNLSNDYKKLIDYLESAYSVNLSKNPSINIENLIADLEPIWSLKIYDNYGENKEFEFDENFEPTNPLDLLRSLLTNIIHSSTKWLSSHECPFHRILASKWLSAGDTVISFNYDLIIDKSLLEQTSWSEVNGYGWNTRENLYVKSLLGNYYTIKKVKYERPPILLLKPHGSLNFNRSVKSRKKEFSNDNQNIIDDFEEYETIEITPLDKIWDKINPQSVILDDKKYRELNHDQQEFIQIMKFARQGKNLYEIGVLPLMIIPSQNKPYQDMIYAEIHLVWQHVHNALINVDEALVCGFSFGDNHFNQVIKDACSKRKTELVLKVIDPSESCINEIKNKLSNYKIRVIPQICELRDFISKL